MTTHQHDTVTPYNDQQAKKAQVEAMFDNIAKSYDFLNHLFSLGIDNIWRNKAVKVIKAAKPSSVIDIACGTGDFTFALQKTGAQKVVGLDLSEGMLEVARKKAKSGSKVEFVKGDGESMPYEENTFEGMTVGFGVRNFQNLEQGLTEMHRILKPGAPLVILEVSEPTKFPVKQLFGLYFHKIMPFVGRLVSKDKRAYSYLPESVQAFPEGKDFEAILTKVGYQNAKWTPLTFGTCAMYVCHK